MRRLSLVAMALKRGHQVIYSADQLLLLVAVDVDRVTSEQQLQVDRLGQSCCKRGGARLLRVAVKLSTAANSAASRSRRLPPVTAAGRDNQRRTARDAIATGVWGDHL